MKNICLGAVR